ncbi:multiple epidermal growth factor-like domains protein 6 isoform X2, partial [Tachysurus ichikawai]
CVEGTYGVGCNSVCVCQNGGRCDPVNGKCLCPPGVQGLNCEDGCPQGFFGVFCQRRCNCPNNGRCHRVYGGCFCAAGLYGRFCHL